MPLVLDYAKDEDFGEMMDVAFDAMQGGSQFVNAVYPHNMTKAGRDKHRQTFLYLKNIDPSQKWLKVTDTATNEIIGVANWQVYDKEKPPEAPLDGPDGTWDDEHEKEWAQAMFAAYMEDRRRVIREATGPVLCEALPCTVESSLAARLLYEQNGFIFKRHYVLAVPKKFADRKKERLFYMYRPKKVADNSA
ncbi:MAG: hypothetical protein Q9227_000565 [Pyrenula ochraceoflavens]